MPGKFMRSRHTAAYYRKMQISECTAASAREYIDIAVHLGTEPEYRAAISNRIAKASEQLWRDPVVIEDLSNAFTAMMIADGYQIF
jgi:predicted O-linked N-acetylglucosamine transferase (SPINDLY family)